MEFNLIDRPWIPCTGGHVGLREALLRADEIHELRGENPLVTISLHRLLLAVVHRVHGPSNAKAWADLWKRRSFDRDRVDRYLGKWRDRFELLTTMRRSASGNGSGRNSTAFAMVKTVVLAPRPRPRARITMATNDFS